MILADTNIFIDFWNSADDKIASIFEKEDVAICGFVRAELLHGAVYKKNFDSITNILGAFEELNLTVEDWQQLGDNLYKLRKKGVQVPFPDAIIATIALKNDIPIWTGDQHFKLIQKVFSKLKLYYTE